MGNNWTTTPQQLGLPSGVYAALIDWQQFAGSVNVQLYSDKNNVGIEDNTAIQAGMNLADDEINLFFSGHYTVPLVFSAGSVTPTVKYWATVIGLSKWLYFGRGLYDQDKVGNHFTQLLKCVYQEMDEYRGAWQRLPCAPVTGPGAGTAPAIAPQTVMPDGSPYSPAAPYPVVRWDGFRWVWG